jgi:hypothetical protein
LLGIEEYIFFPDPTPNYHLHANCWIKFLSASSIALLDVPAGSAAFEITAGIRRRLESEGYTVYPIPAPRFQPYLNSVIFNNTIFVPIVGNPQTDEAALDAYRAAGPNMEIIGVYSETWLSSDALDCRVLTIPIMP